LTFSWIDKPWFLTEGKLAAVLIIPSSWGSQLDGEKLSTPRRISEAKQREPDFALFLLVQLEAYCLNM
jgi:hypothetical protein